MASGQIRKPIEEVALNKEKGILEVNGSKEISFSQTGTGIVLITVSGNNIERGYIRPFYIVNPYCYQYGNEILNYSFNQQSQSVLIEWNKNILTITNNTTVNVNYKVAVISAYRG